MYSDKVFKRTLNIKLPTRQSAFLWGARQAGKSSYLKQQFPKSIYFDLLKSDLFLSFTKEPHLFREELLQRKPTTQQQPIILDEVQRVPLLLDEVHWLIENEGMQFLLCGSSARKLKRGHANLLGGRAWKYEMFPLVFPEIPNFDELSLLHAMNSGLLPSIFLSTSYEKSLQAYVQDYLTEEIRAEGLSRNLRAFSKFLDSIAYSNCEMVVYKNIASDCGVDSKTVKEYYEILVDTHLGKFLMPLVKKKGRKTIQSIPKFYLFDMGVANFLSKTKIQALKGQGAGKTFEQFVFNELIAYRSYNDLNFEINYWHTTTDLEVDFVLNHDEFYIETKMSDNIKSSNLKGLLALIDEKRPKKAIVVCNEKRARLITGSQGQSIEIYPWRNFLEALWSGGIV